MLRIYHFITTDVKLVGVGGSEKLAILRGCPGAPGAPGPAGSTGPKGSISTHAIPCTFKQFLHLYFLFCDCNKKKKPQCPLPSHLQTLMLIQWMT